MALNIEKLKERLENKGGRADRFDIKDGENNIRILPPSLEYLADNIDYISVEYLMHFNIGIEGNKTAEICPKTFSKAARCPICEAVAKLYKLNTAEDKVLASQIRAKKRHLFNIIDMNDKEKGIQILEVGPKIYEYLVVFITNPKWGDLLDLDKGRDITIFKTNAKESATGYADYSVSPDPSVSSIRADLPKNFKEAIQLLKKAVPQAKTYEELKAILEGEEFVPSDKVQPKEESLKEVDSIEEADSSEGVVEEKSKAKEVAEEPKKKSTQQPTCFGEQYGPRRTECVSCSFKVECKKAFLDM